MLWFLVVIAVLGVPAVAAAQPVAIAQFGLRPLPRIGLPLPPIGLPLPRIGLPPVTAPLPHRVANRVTGNERRPHRGVIYFVPAYGWPFVHELAATNTRPGPTPPSDAPADRQWPTGRLRLAVQPVGNLQVHVDGYYVGTPEDFDGELEIQAGQHIVEIRKTGYEALQVPVDVTGGRTITYRGTLTPTVEQPTPAAVPSATTPDPAPAMTSYFIPGCYLGNVPPAEAALPPGCDTTQVMTIHP